MGYRQIWKVLLESAVELRLLQPDIGQHAACRFGRLIMLHCNNIGSKILEADCREALADPGEVRKIERMFESGDSSGLADRITAMRVELVGSDGTLTDVESVDVLGALERLKSGCAALQAKVAAEFAAKRRAERAERGMSKRKQGEGISSEVALARFESPHKGNRLLGFAEAVVHEMPNLFARMLAGDLNEWRATILVRETACLSREDRGVVDRELCSDPATLANRGDNQIKAAAIKLGAKLDAEAMVRRARKAVANRCVTSRPAPDGMAYLTALLPMKQAVTVHATLMRDAAAVVAKGDERTKSQIMADLLVERVTGLATATAVPITVNVVLSDEALLGRGSEAGYIPEYGPAPAGLIREWLHDDDATLQLRRLYVNPDTGALTAVESTSRGFPKGLLRMTRFRDRICRTPWCDAAIRHGDHIVSVEEGGGTTYDNSAGLCEACNYAKQAEGWSAKPDVRAPGELHSYTITTPTGHRYRSTAPPLETPLRLRIRNHSQVERMVADILTAA
jgi:hypothetical protein